MYLLNSSYPRGPLAHTEMLAIMDTPPYWAFCWASGQVLAEYIIKHPYEFKDQTLLDIGCGSGVAGIAAKIAGAKKVISCDTDPMALNATEANAKLNRVELEYLNDIACLEDEVDLIIAADILYDRDNFSLLQTLPKLGREVLLADSRIKNLERQGYTLIDCRQITTLPDLNEQTDFNEVKLYKQNYQ